MRNALQAAGHSIRPRGPEAFMASCPLHTDRSPSLSVGWRENTRAGTGGAVLLHCFSCQSPADAIAAALGLRLTDLFAPPNSATLAAPGTTQGGPTRTRTRCSSRAGCEHVGARWVFFRRCQCGVGGDCSDAASPGR